VLRRLDCVLEPTKADVLARNAAIEGRVDDVAPVLNAITGILDEPDFQQTVLDHYAERLYERLRRDEDQLGLTQQT
jgi:hypothetical protein